MTVTKTQFLLTVAAYLLVSASTAHAGWWDGDGDDGPWNGNGNGGGRGCWWGSGECDDDNDDDNDDNSNDVNASALGLTEEQLNHTNRIITIHAVLASLVWVFLIPVGGILIRSGIKSPWIVRLHAFLQSISYLIYIAAVGAGIYLVRQLSSSYYNLWDDPHPKLGIAVLVLAFFQPITGLIHHVLFKRRAAVAKAGTSSKLPGRTAPGYAHLWLGRILIVLGMINGGLGLRLASNSPLTSNSRAKTIAYGVGAAIMFLLYVIFVVLGERRRSKERHGRLANSHNSVPLVGRGGDGGSRSGPVAPAYNAPPTYEDSQESLRKEQETVARYS